MSNDRPISPRVALRMIAVLGGAAVLTACAAFSPDGGMDLVSGIASEELKKDAFVIRTPEQASAVRAHVQHLMRKPLTADAAVQIALLNNRGLQAAYNELGIAEAAMVGASLPPNPTFSFARIVGPGRTRDRAAHRRQYPGARDLAGARRRSPPTVSGRRSCARPRRRCGSPPRRAAPTTARSPRASWSASSRRRRPRPKPRASLPSGSARPAP